MAPPMSRPGSPRARTAAEAAVWRMFTDVGKAGYQAIACCANPRCETPGMNVMTCGTKPDTRICIACFEFDFDCKHPSRAKLRGLINGREGT